MMYDAVIYSTMMKTTKGDNSFTLNENEDYQVIRSDGVMIQR